MQYAIPQIQIEPELSFCQKCVVDVAKSIVDASKIIAGTFHCQ